MLESPSVQKHDFVFIKSEYKIVKIKFDDILFCKGMKDYIQIYVQGKSNPIVTLKSLNAFETKLPRIDLLECTGPTLYRWFILIQFQKMKSPLVNNWFLLEVFLNQTFLRWLI